MIWFFEFLYGFSLCFTGLVFVSYRTNTIALPIRLGLSFPIGFAAIAFGVLLLLLLKVPVTLFSLGLLVTLALAGFIFISAKKGAMGAKDLAMDGLVLLIIVALITLIQSQLKASVMLYDAFKYATLTGNITLIDNGLWSPPVKGFISSYSGFLAFGNAPAGFWGADYSAIASILFAVFIAILASGLIYDFGRSIALPRGVLITACLSAPLLILSTPQFIYHSVYYMPNLPMAAFFFCACACIWLITARGQTAAYAPLVITLIAVSICRLEGVLFLNIIGLLFVATPVKNPKARLFALGIACTVAAVWMFILYTIIPANVTGTIISKNGALALSVLSLAPVIAAALWLIAPLRPLITLGSKALPALIVLICLYMTTKDFAHTQDTASHMIHNMTSRVGMSGYTWAVLFVLLMIFTVYDTSKTHSGLFLRIVISSVFLVIMLGLYREFPYRLGAQDSGNRIMLQILPAWAVFSVLMCLELLDKSMKNVKPLEV
ncbi:MAG: hypothetical protein ACSHXY_00050 [Alphaproteobacteria bacterium]